VRRGRAILFLLALGVGGGLLMMWWLYSVMAPVMNWLGLA